MMGQSCTLGEFADEVELRGEADTPEGDGAIQRLEKWADMNLMKFSKFCSPRHHCVLCTGWLGSSSAEKALGVLVGIKLTVSQQHALAVEEQVVSWAPLEGVLPAGQGRWSFPSAQEW